MKIIFIFAILLFALNCDLKPSEKTKLDEFRQIHNQIPVHESFQLIDEQYNIKDNLGVFTRFYTLTASYEEIKNFYRMKLPEHGWTFSNEEIFGFTGRESFLFKKDSYHIAIEYDALKSNANYAISLSWNLY